MITEKDYKNLKEMWDYQRMLEYNKEQLMNKISSLLDNTFIADVTEEEMFEVFCFSVMVNLLVSINDFLVR